MEKNIKDYLHLYLGCEIYIFPPKTATNGWLKTQVERIEDLGWKYILSIENINKTIKDGYCPILRPLSDMTEEERIWWFNNMRKPNETLDESVWTTELNGEPCEAHWSLWCKEKLFGCRHAYVIDIQHHVKPDEFIWLLSKHFDLFGLIEAGLAIDKTKI
jgi:hypothetical protein